MYGWLLFCPQFFILTGDRQSGFTTLCVPSHQYDVQNADTDSVSASEVSDSDSSERLRLDMFSSIVASRGEGNPARNEAEVRPGEGAGL